MKRGSILGASVLALAVASPASAGFLMGAGGGVFGPYDGNTGFAIVGQAMGEIGDGHWRFGGEFQYRDFKSEFFKVQDVEVQMFQLQAFTHYRFLPDAPVTPYVGVGIGLAVNVIDTDRIERERPNVDVFNSAGVGVGGFGVLGIEVPAGPHVVFFVEGRATGDVQITQTNGNTDTENLGGGEGLAGVRIRF